ncbi:MAG: hypothetical protein ACOYNO_11655, partial [Saprospiraceae bacterium]
HLYHWNIAGISDPGSPIYDKIIAGKKGFLNPVFFTVGTVGFLAIWFFWARGLRNNSLAQDANETPSLDYYKKERKWAASFLPLGGFLSTVFIWELVMSIDTHWYSTMFAWYSTISLLLAALALMIMLIIYLKNIGYLEYVNRDHLHDMGKYLFGLSVFWMYLWFDQYMLIWYSNVGEETIYFKERMDNYAVLFWGNMLLNFVTPFFILMRNDTKRKFGTMFFVALIVFIGHWWDFFYMIKPGARIAAFETKELLEKKHQSSLMNDAKVLKASYTFEAGEQDQHGAKDAVEKAGAKAHEAKPHTEEHPAAAHAAEGHHTATDTAHAAKGHEAHDTTEAHAEGAEAHHEAATHGAADAAHEGAGHGDAHGAEAHHGPDKSFKLGYTLPGFPEIGTLIGFLSLFLFMFFRNLQSAPLVPLKDPYLEESLHHSTGVYIEGEDNGDSHH